MARRANAMVTQGQVADRLTAGVAYAVGLAFYAAIVLGTAINVRAWLDG